MSFQRSVWFSVDAGSRLGLAGLLVHLEEVIHRLRAASTIPKTRAQPEEPNSKRSRPSGNNTSTGISPVPPIRQATRGLTNGRQHIPHLVACTASIRTKQLVNVRTGQPHPAANPPNSKKPSERILLCTNSSVRAL